MSTLVPSRLVLHRASRLLEVGYADGSCFQLPCEYLRVYSPSAERTLRMSWTVAWIFVTRSGRACGVSM